MTTGARHTAGTATDVTASQGPIRRWRRGASSSSDSSLRRSADPRLAMAANPGYSSHAPFGDRDQAARQRRAFVRFRGSPLVAAQLHGQPQPRRGHEIERLPPSQRANGGGDHQPGRVAADDVRRFVREERAELVVRQLAQRADRHADFTRERDRHAQRAAAR